jgi:hypothetical protein
LTDAADVRGFFWMNPRTSAASAKSAVYQFSVSRQIWPIRANFFRLNPRISAASAKSAVYQFHFG